MTLVVYYVKSVKVMLLALIYILCANLVLTVEKRILKVFQQINHECSQKIQLQCFHSLTGGEPEKHKSAYNRCFLSEFLYPQSFKTPRRLFFQVRSLSLSSNQYSLIIGMISYSTISLNQLSSVSFS